MNAAPAFGSDYRQNFSFTHRSIRGLLSPSRPYNEPSDTADKITPRFLAEVATLITDLINGLDTQPPRVR